MKTFLSFISEEANSGVASARHQDHPEDNAVHSREGFSHAVSTLRAIHKGLKSGNTDSDTHVSTKLDGAPAIVFGHHPKTGKFFVATKHAAFGKTPKLATTHEEIEQHFGHSPGLAQKLHHALDHLPKVTPKKGMFQGDYMHDEGDRSQTNDEVSFKPNTIRYHVKKDTEEGKKAVRSRIGIAVHTKIEGNPDNSSTLVASPLTDHSTFKKHPDVHMVSPEASMPKKNPLSKEENQAVQDHLSKAEEIHNKLSPSHHEIINRHQDHFDTYINKTVRTGEKPTTEGLRKHIQERMQKEVDKVSTPAAKARKTESMNAALAHHDAHQKEFQHALNIHHHIQAAKDILTKGLHRAQESSNPLQQSLDSKKTDPEGYVVQHKGRIVKMVNRAEFSQANFNKPKDWVK